MKLLRYAFGIFVITFGMMVCLGCIVDIVRGYGEAPSWLYGVIGCVLGIGPIAGGCFLLRQYTRIQPPTCPKCGNTAGEAATIVRKSPFFRIWLFGWLGVLFSVWLGGKPKRFRCNTCEETFSTDSRGAAIARICFWVLITFIALIVLLVCCEANTPSKIE